MPYLIIDKSLRQVLETSVALPATTEPNLLVIEVKSLDAYNTRRLTLIATGVDASGNSLTKQVWVDGTTFTQAQITAYVDQQAARSTQMSTAIASIIASVNGKLVTTLTQADALKILVLIAANEGWIDKAGKMAIPTDILAF
jgi:hypothetical protein